MKAFSKICFESNMLVYPSRDNDISDVRGMTIHKINAACGCGNNSGKDFYLIRCRHIPTSTFLERRLYGRSVGIVLRVHVSQKIEMNMEQRRLQTLAVRYNVIQLS